MSSAVAAEPTVKLRIANVESGQVQTDRDLNRLLAEVRACRACEAHLPLGPRPVIRAGGTARILIVGQARRQSASSG